MSVIVKVTGESIRRAADVLQSGGLIAFPTESYYGLGVDPFNEEALRRLFKVKNRPVHLPVLVIVDDLIQANRVTADIPDVYRQLIRYFWPGPLTLVCQGRPQLSPLLTGNTRTIGIRQSPNIVARKLVSVLNGPITATSANLSGSLPAVTAQEVADSLGTQVDMILDGGQTPGGKGSTVIGLKKGSLYCIREGMIEFRTIQQIHLD